MMKRIIFTLFIVSLFASCQRAGASREKSERASHGLKGGVQSVRAESSQVMAESGGWREVPRGIAETRTYDPGGKMVEEAFYGPDGSLLLKVDYIYSADGLKKEKAVYDPSRTLREKTVFDYNERGLVSGGTDFRGGNSAYSKSSYQHDDRGNLTERLVRNARGALSDRWTYAYDDRGNCIEETRFYSEGTVDARYLIAYDESGRPVERSKYKADGSLVEKERYDYELDATGNWIKRTTSRMAAGSDKSDFTPVEVTYRTISYK